VKLSNEIMAWSELPLIGRLGAFNQRRRQISKPEPKRKEEKDGPD